MNFVVALVKSVSGKVMSNPYKTLPDYSFWSRAVRAVAPREVDPVVFPKFQVTKAQKIASAGSCFAQHIARYLRSAGCNFLVVEDGHPVVPSELLREYGYGVYSARYGNIYTPRQLLQLFDRAFNRFHPRESEWRISDECWVDSFRPAVQPGGFSSLCELRSDREWHLSKVRKMFGTLDVFVFTLGLTESWVSVCDGAVYPVCPGVNGGVFDPQKYRFVNFSLSDTVNDLEQFLARLREINPSAQVILTVSPVPLVATASGGHVLSATTYSKSVLRVAAEEISRNNKNVEYFPSYEIITGGFARGVYFADDLRSVTEAGVSHVMGVFLKHYIEQGDGLSGTPDGYERADSQSYFAGEMDSLVKVNCEELLYERSNT